MSSTSSLPVFDIIVLGFLVVAALVGFISGFTGLFLGIGGWLGAIAAGFFAAPYLKPYFMSFIPNDFFASLAAGFVVFIFTLSLLIYISRSISNAIKSSSSGGVDRLLGFLFSIALGSGLLSGGFIFFPSVVSADTYSALTKNSHAVPFLQKGGEILKQMISHFLEKNQVWQPQSSKESLPSDHSLEELKASKPKITSQEEDSKLEKEQGKELPQSKDPAPGPAPEQHDL